MTRRLDEQPAGFQRSPADTASPVAQADAAAVDVAALRRELETQLSGEVRFDSVSRALYSTDASVYQIVPLGVVVPKSREDVVHVVEVCRRFRCPITARGGGTSQAGQAVGSGIQLDLSKYLNRLLELNLAQRWARVEPGIVLDELNAALRPYGLRFAPDISTASRATLGGMIANNSCGARSLIYGKTIDHVQELDVVLADGAVARFRPLAPAELDAACAGGTIEAAGYRTVRRVAAESADEIDRRFPKLVRRVGGYNLDAFVRTAAPTSLLPSPLGGEGPGVRGAASTGSTPPTPHPNPLPQGEREFNLAKLIVGSEGTLGIVVEAKVSLVPLPQAKAVLVIHFAELLDALAATPTILLHQPSAVEVTDRFILSYTRENPALERLKSEFVRGDPGALLLVEFYADRPEDLPRKLDALEHDLTARGYGYHCHRATELEAQGRIWSLREAALGLSMAMKGDAKSLSFVEDTAVAPDKLRDYIERFLQIVRRHETTAGVYAHASVGCLHVRPVINLKTADGVQQFEAIAGEVADLVLEYGGALSGEHGDGLVRSPFTRKMFGPVLYEAFREIKRTFDPLGIFNPGKIVDAPPMSANLRYGPGYQTPDPPTYFDYSEHGGLGRAVEMCSGVGACRKKLDGTMCPSYMATLEETHTTRGRANVLRLAMNGRLGDAALTDRQIYDVLDLCLECRACKVECPVGVDMARFKSEFLAGYRARHGTPLAARVLGNIAAVARWGSRFAPLSNWLARGMPGRRLGEKLLDIDRRRVPPAWRRHTLRKWFAARPSHPRSSPDARSSRAAERADQDARVTLFADTFTNYLEPEIGIAATELLESLGLTVELHPRGCCGRPPISQGLLDQARRLAESNTEILFPFAERGRKFLFCEPSCLSAMREDAPSLLRGELQRKAHVVAGACLLLEEFLETECAAGRLRIEPRGGPPKILLHGHCHQKAMGLLRPALALLSRIPGSTVVDLDAGCCGMAGSFGYLREHYEISRTIGERRLLPAVRNREPGTVVVVAGTSCRHQIEHFTGEAAVHPAVLLRPLLTGTH